MTEISTEIIPINLQNSLRSFANYCGKLYCLLIRSESNTNEGGMKMLQRNTLFLLALLLIGLPSLKAQNNFYGELKGNDLRARFNATGQLFWDGKNAVFQTPKGSGLNTISASSLWIGALDDQGNLHLSAQTYRESGTDFWAGPLKVADGSTTTLASDQFNKVWYISRLLIDSFKAGLSIPNEILNWPANGNTADGYSQQLAPFVDLNGNGIYEPLNGEYPDMKGDEMLWWVFNDNLAAHTESGGTALKVEVQASAYTYDCSGDPILRNTIFVDYKIINRSANTYNNAHIGLWSDIDIGNLYDDRIGSDPALQLYYGYNGNTTDRDTTLTAGNDTFVYKGFGNKLPAQGVLFPGGLTGPGNSQYTMSGFMYYNNNNGDSVNGNPTKPAQYYNLLRSRWLNGQNLTEGGNGTTGTNTVKFSFPGDIRTNTGWTDLGNKPGDRRGLGTFGPISMSPGDEFTLSTAYLYAQSPSGLTAHSAALVKNQERNLEQLYRSNALQACTGMGFCQSGDTCVFPGDADRDGKAFMYDMFNLGYAFGESGPKRPFASSAWVGQPGASWGRTFPDGTDYRHADANGDGKIDSADVLPIVLNYGSMHLKGGRSTTAADPILKLDIVEDTATTGREVTIDVKLGSDQQPAPGVFGVAFRVSFEPSLLEPGSITMDVTNSELATQDKMVMLQKYNPADGTVDFGLVKTDKFVKDIKGLIMRWKYVIDPMVIGGKKAHAKVDYVEVVDTSLTVIPVTAEGDEVYVLSTGKGIKSKAVGTPFSLYPNPANQNIYLQLPALSRVAGQVNIYTLQGMLISHVDTKPGENKIHLDIQNLPSGMYLVELQTSEGRTVQRFIKN
jgi:hypothetical protein